MYVCTAFVFAVAASRGGSWKILCPFAPHLSIYIKSFLVEAQIRHLVYDTFVSPWPEFMTPRCPFRGPKGMFVAVLRVPLFYVKGTFHVSVFLSGRIFSPAKVISHWFEFSCTLLSYISPNRLRLKATPRREAWAGSRRDTFARKATTDLQVLFQECAARMWF